MLKNIFRIFLIFCALIATPATLWSQCKAKQVMNGCKANLGKYTYDTYLISELTLDDKPHMLESQFTAFGGEKYKIIFCSYNLGEDMVALDIYDKNNKVKNRKKIFDNSNGIDNLFWSFTPTKSGSYYIEYSMPPTKDGKVKKGCVVMIIGYIEDED